MENDGDPQEGAVVSFIVSAVSYKIIAGTSMMGGDVSQPAQITSSIAQCASSAPTVCHKRIAGNDFDESLWLFVVAEFLRAAYTRSLEHPKPHDASADCKTRHELSVQLASKHLTCVAR
jgi:hypothetical protein